MCIGIPMQVRESGAGYAICEGLGIKRRVETLLTGDQPPGAWLLVFLDSAREVLSEDDAHKISNAVRAVDLVMNSGRGTGEQGLDPATIEALFADLVEREPPKPASLIALEQDRLDTGGE